jgi:RNase P subunit RPR2
MYFAEKGQQGVSVEMVEAYCVKCKTKREMSNPNQITMKNGKPAVQGSCPNCGTKLFRIGATLA